MTLDEIPVYKTYAVILDKFIVAELTDTGGRKKIVVRSGWHGHSDLAGFLQDELDDSNIYPKIIGGGKIILDPARQSVEIYGESTSYGSEPNRQTTVTIIQAAYPGFQITSGS
ncbi:MAG: hypothetical protein A3D44_04280 [Candidatus Staskawiczbacteria bacterium RIFCSPHIGHO2_02_FULL_42_22]|uniref:Uncharacterized protein n=1 Tax=Candidatus Staskawiczbacteria bacterium RIFCSPHIGHO2_02_FULL_42_22 TaxID=1802207 RepID=A0A1G2I336_9BACT|nr:MAG: hypothetical protein A3D44_04280 [Candidatus Staskawiczbacteria bacterium RIFCSPHIGHO2_02_FULL_42_22]